MLVDLAVNDRGHVGCDSDIIVGHVDVRQLSDFKKIGADLDLLASGSGTRSLDVLGQSQSRRCHGDLVFAKMGFCGRFLTVLVKRSI